MRINFQLKKKKGPQPELLTIKKRGNKKNALIIYVTLAVKEWIEKNYKDENFNSHSMYWESIEMVKQLNAKGYNVDFADCTSPLPAVEWTKYDLVFDERNNCYNIPLINGQKRVFYATGCHWLTQNLGELQRIQSFRERHGIVIPPLRQVQPIMAESTADFVSFFGGPFQKNSFSNPERTVPLFQSTTILPVFEEKNIDTCRRNFLWLGSKGLIHKGLDIVLEAFKNHPEFNLHICTDIEGEPLFYKWFEDNFSTCVNIHYHGWMNIHDKAFQQIANDCIATVNCSVSEGGAGANIQAMQFGCIPVANDVVDDSTYLKGDATGFRLQGTDSSALIYSLSEMLDQFSDLPGAELLTRSRLSKEYANTYHSRQSYSDSFHKLLNLVGE